MVVSSWKTWLTSSARQSSMTKFESSFAVTGWDHPERVLGAEMEDDKLEADEEDGADIVSEWSNSSEWIKRWVEKSGDVFV